MTDASPTVAEAGSKRVHAAYATAVASRVSTAQSRFLATMSHDILTPISGVIGMFDLLVPAKHGDEVPRYRAARSS